MSSFRFHIMKTFTNTYIIVYTSVNIAIIEQFIDISFDKKTNIDNVKNLTLLLINENKYAIINWSVFKISVCL